MKMMISAVDPRIRVIVKTKMKRKREHFLKENA